MNRLKSFAEFIKENKNTQADVKQLCFDHHELFLMLPALVFVLTPVYQLVTNLLFDGDYAFHGFYTFNYTVDYAIYFSLLAAPAALALYCIKKKKNGEKIITGDCVPMMFFAAVSLLIIASTCVNGFTQVALHGDMERGESVFSFLVYFMAMYLCSSLIEKESNKKIIINTFLFSNTVINLATIFHLYVRPITNWEFSDPDAPSAIFYQFNHYGYFLMLGIVVSAALFVTGGGIKSRIFPLAALVLNTFVLTLNTTFGCFLACIAGFAFLMIADSVVKKRLSFMTIAAFAVYMLVTFIAGLRGHSFITELGSFFKDIESVLGVVNEKVANSAESTVSSAADDAGTGRWGLWRFTFGYIKEKPILGWGIEGIAERLASDSGGLNNRPHNEYLEYAAFFGIPAALMYVCGIAASFVKAVINRSRLSSASLVCLTAAFTYLFSAIFGNTMLYTAAYMFIFLGLSVKTSKAE